ncbi:MAG: hypothetical protein E5V18_25175 [Mesorhizobium sp.]|nr:MAG: hypothetical protein E5V18_25175 [Mesorhizobium sp.]
MLLVQLLRVRRGSDANFSSFSKDTQGGAMRNRRHLFVEFDQFGEGRFGDGTDLTARRAVRTEQI